MIVFAVQTASAEIPIQECGKPPAAELKTDPGGVYCNIYSRQLAYADEAVKFRKLMIERQKNFAAPSLKASQQYREDVRTRHGFPKHKTSNDDAEPGFPESEAFGPELNP